MEMVRRPPGLADGFVCSGPRVKTRGYSPMPLRGNPLPTDAPAPEGRRHVAAGFNPRNGVIPTDAPAPEGRRHVAAGFNPRDGVHRPIHQPRRAQACNRGF